MTRPFAEPYILFYPFISRDGAAFPINKAIQEIQRRSFRRSKGNAWRGNIVVAKFRSGGADPFLSMMDISVADFPLLKNHFMNYEPKNQV